METALAGGRAVLDRAYEQIEREGSVEDGMDGLVVGLRALRQSSPPRAWEAFCRTECVGHPVRFLVHQDPLTERAYFKPRGYPGDAVLLDLFYGGGGGDTFPDDAPPPRRPGYQKTTQATPPPPPPPPPAKPPPPTA